MNEKLWIKPSGRSQRPDGDPPPPEIKPRHAGRHPLIITAAVLAMIVLIYLVVKTWPPSPESTVPLKNPAMTASGNLYLKYKNAGDANFNRNDFESARRQYQQALEQKPNDRYATARIDSCDRKIALIKERQQLHTKSKDTGDALFKQGKYAEAKSAYEQAREYAADDDYVARKIQECNRLLTPTQRPKAEPARPATKDMVLVEAGTFKMGSENGSSDEQPMHEVYVDAFYIDVKEVTVEKFKRFIDATGYKTDAEKKGWSWVSTGTLWEEKQGANWRHDPKGEPAGNNYPVIHVSWNDAIEYCKWLSRTTSAKYRLPTEAEWEYAARGGHKAPYEWGKGSAHIGKYQYAGSDYLGEVGWYNENSNGKIHPVAAKKPNELGLYNMSGNVWEWCQDWYDGKYYDECKKKGIVKNSEGPETGSNRVLRGGSWSNVARFCRSAYRYDADPANRDGSIGFRLVFVP